MSEENIRSRLEKIFAFQKKRNHMYVVFSFLDD
jgi:hypothetical protein